MRSVFKNYVDFAFSFVKSVTTSIWCACTRGKMQSGQLSSTVWALRIAKKATESGYERPQLRAS